MNKKHLLLASILFAGFAQADDYASPGLTPVSAFGEDVIGHEESLAEPMSCTEARDTAWFIRELSRTDGETNPDVEYVPCGREILARSAADQD
jgi:hypothetical protein